MWAEVSDYDLPFIEPPRTILDIGANIGAFSLLAHQRWPEAMIHAWEPVDDNIGELINNTNFCADQVKVNGAAVRGFSGEADILLGDRGVTCGFHQLGRQTANTERCRCVDAATLPRADYIKIDTEGCEVEILGRLDLTETKAVAVEYHRREDVALLKHLAELNGLELWKEKPLGDTWGLLIFTRAGVLTEARSAVPQRKLFIALPVYGALDVFFTQSLIKVLNDPPVAMMLRLNPGDSLVSRSRNTLTADFLESDATHLLFIDTDLIFSGDQIERILAHQEDVVGGFYPKKQEGPVQWVCNAHLSPNEPRADGLQDVRYMGTGFLCTHRRVFERMIEVYGEQLRYKADHRDRTEYDFWSVGTYQYPDGSRRYLSEDWFFCQRALDLGFKVWGDTKIVLKHVGQAIYPLKSQESELFGVPLPTMATDTAGPSVIAPAPPAHSLRRVQAAPAIAAAAAIRT